MVVGLEANPRGTVRDSVGLCSTAGIRIAVQESGTTWQVPGRRGVLSRRHTLLDSVCRETMWKEIRVRFKRRRIARGIRAPITH